MKGKAGKTGSEERAARGRFSRSGRGESYDKRGSLRSSGTVRDALVFLRQHDGRIRPRGNIRAEKKRSGTGKGAGNFTNPIGCHFFL
jgi:hypothetical protein